MMRAKLSGVYGVNDISKKISSNIKKRRKNTTNIGVKKIFKNIDKNS